MGKVIPLRRDGYKVEGEAVRIAMYKPRRRRWNRRKSADNLRTVIGVSAIGLFFGYLILSWLAGVQW